LYTDRTACPVQLIAEGVDIPNSFYWMPKFSEQFEQSIQKCLFFSGHLDALQANLHVCILEYALFTGTEQFFNADFIEKHYLTDEGWKKCQEVLAVLSQLHCDVTFCPILQQLVCIFMHFMDKEDCFACIDSIFSSKKYKLDKTTTDYCLTAKTFQDALKKWKVRMFMLDF
jgi:hypothetical protein